MRYLQDLEKICKINSFTNNKAGVDAVGEHMQKWLEELDFKTEIYKRTNIGDHLLFLSAKTDGDKILLLGHNDTVFPEGVFEEFTQDEEWIYRAGVCDMKGGNYVALEALRNVKKKQGKIHNIDFLLVSDEETGSDDSKFITYIINQCLANVPEIKLTKGEQKRDFIFIDDVVRAYLLLLKHGKKIKEQYLDVEVGSGTATTIRDMVILIASLTKTKSRLAFGTLPYRENEIMESRANIEFIEKMGWKPEISLEEGIAKTIKARRQR